MASEIRCKSPVVPNFFCRIFRVAAMNGKVKFNGEETKQHDGKWCYLFVSSKQFQQAMTALSTYLWHSAQPRDSCYAHRRVRDTPWMWRLQFQSSNHSSRTSKLSTSMRFRKKGREIIHWHKSFTDLFFFPLEQLVSNGIQKLQLSNISETDYTIHLCFQSVENLRPY